MLCPVCGTEYREGFFTCSDCSVPLVAELPEKEETLLADASDGELADDVRYEGNLGELVAVYETLDQSEILIIRSVLDEERIPYHVSGDFFRMSGIYISPARLFVPSTLKEMVLEILKDLQMIS